MNKRYKELPTQVYYLEMHKKPEVKTDEVPNATFSKVASPITTEEYLKYYTTVGEKYNWNDRVLMNKATLYSKINDQKTEIFVYSIEENIAGFAEFIREKEYTEILYFGLFPDYIGKGFGKHFLQKVIQEAWSNNPEWIQLNTCELDHPNALSVYQKCGFELQKTTIENRKVSYQ